VAALQRVLRGLGRPVVVDGAFGATTQAALTDLQRQLGIPLTGQLDPNTVRALTRPL
jgi:peptidoglycan hydrolase-like protein with peptidoglycan-binding domain